MLEKWKQKLASKDCGRSSGRELSQRSFDIETRSFQIIDAEIISHDYNELEWSIVRRVIHATADFDFAKESRIVFHKDAIQSAFDAFKKKSPIITDVDMVLSAINKKLVKNLELETICHISDSTLVLEAQKHNKTRSEMAMHKGVDKMQNAIIAIGNAPTALYEAIKMVREGLAKPSLLIGVPVGFVSAPESKQELAKTNIPFITNIGRKGGSSVASSIVNALMLLYTSQNK